MENKRLLHRGKIVLVLLAVAWLALQSGAYILLRQPWVLSRLGGALRNGLGVYDLDVSFRHLRSGPGLGLELDGLILRDRRSQAHPIVFQAAHLYARVSLWRLLLQPRHPEAAVTEILIDRPRLTIARTRGSWLWERFRAVKPTANRFHAVLRLHQGRVFFATPPFPRPLGREITLRDARLDLGAYPRLAGWAEIRTDLDAGLQLSVKGSYDLENGRGQADIRWEGAMAARWQETGWLPRQPVEVSDGLVAGSARLWFGGKVRVDEATLRLSRGRLRYAASGWPWMEAAGEARLRGRQVELNNVRISTERSALRVDGRLELEKHAPRVAGVVRLSALDLGEAAGLRLLPLPGGVVPGGKISGRITVAGCLPTPRLGGEITLADGAITAPKLPAVDRIRARGRFTGSALLLEALGGEVGGSKLTGNGLVGIFPVPSLDLRLEARDASLAQSLAAIGQPDWRGKTNLKARLQAAPGHLEAEADLDWQDASWQERPLPPGTGRIAFRGTGGKDLAVQGTARLGGGLVSIDGFRQDSNWHGTGKVEHLALAQITGLLGLGPKDLGGEAAGEIDWRIDRTGPSATAAVQVSGPSLAGRKFETGQASLAWQGGAVTVEAGRLQVGEAEALARGSYLPGSGVMAMDLALHRFPLDLLLPGMDGTADGRLNLSGRWPAITGGGWAHLYDLAWRGMPLGTAECEVDLGENRLVLKEGRLTAAEGQVEFDGSVGLTEEGLLALNLTGLDWEAGTLAALLPGHAGLRGRVRGEGRVSGTLTDPRIDANLTAGPGEIYDVAWESASAILHWEDRLEVAEGRIKAFGTEIELAGVLGPDGWDLAVRVREAQLAAIAGALPYDVPLPAGKLDGRVAVTGKIYGSLAAPLLTGEVIGTDLGIGGFACAALSSRFTLRDGVLTLSALEARDEGRSYEAAGWIDLFRREAALDLRMQRGDLPGMLSLAGIRPPWPVKGALSGQARLSGALDHPHVQGSLRLAEGALGPMDLEGRAVFAYDGWALRVDRLELAHGESSLAASGQASPDQLQLELAGEALPLEELAGLAGYGGLLTGRADLRFSLVRTGATLRGNYRITAGSDATWASIPLERAVAEGTIEDRWIRLSRAELVSGGHTLQAAGKLPFPGDLGPGEALLRGIPPASGGLDLTVEASRLSLPLLNPAFGNLLAFDGGEMDLAARITGPWSAPEVTGRLAVAGGKGRTSLLSRPFTDLTATAEMARGELQIRAAKARIGQGSAEMDGVISRSPAGWRYDLRLRGRRIPYQNPFFFDGQASRLDLAVTGGPVPRITGEIEVTESTITVGSGVSSGVPPPPIPFDINLVAGRDVRFFLPGVADIPFDGRLRLAGTLAAPALTGVIEVSRGAVYVYGERFALTGGTATFTADRGYLPYVELQAEKTIRGTRLLAQARGEITESGLTILLRSEPALGQQEILSLLRWSGGSREAAPGPTPGSMALGGLELVVDTVFGQLSEDFRRLIDADQLELGMDEQTGGLSLQLGKFFWDDLYVSYKIRLNEFEDREWSFDYRLNPSLVLSGVFSTTEDPTWSLAYQIRF